MEVNEEALARARALLDRHDPCPPPPATFHAEDPDYLVTWWRAYTAAEGPSPAPQVGLHLGGRDLDCFLNSFSRHVSDRVDDWTAAVTADFLRTLTTVRPEGPEQRRARAAAVSRVTAALHRFADWVHAWRPFRAGHPTAGLDDPPTPG